MTVTLAERTALRAAVRDLLSDRCTEQDVRRVMADDDGFDRGLWRQLAELGITGMLIDPRYGGAGLGPVELEAVAEETGAALLPAPFIASGVLAAALIAAAGSEQDRAAAAAGPGRRHLDRDRRADRPGAEPGPPDGVAVTAAAGRGTLTGTATYVRSGRLADVLLVVARTADGVGVFEVRPDAPGFTRAALEVFDPTVRLSSFGFDHTPARRLGAAGRRRERRGWDPVQRALDLAVVALAGEQAGGARAILDLTVDYLRTRVQFGRLIGSFQSLKHYAADLLLTVESATSAAQHAAAELEAGSPGAAGAVALAGFACAEAFETTALYAIQMHGGIGFTWEHPAHLYLRRARSGVQLLGRPRPAPRALPDREGGLTDERAPRCRRATAGRGRAAGSSSTGPRLPAETRWERATPGSAPPGWSRSSRPATPCRPGPPTGTAAACRTSWPT